MLRLHHLEYSRSFRILWALEELGLDYQLVNYQRLPNLAAPASLKAIHPLGKAPILEDDQQVIAESAVILEHLRHQYDLTGKFIPQDSNAYTFWLHFAESSLMPYLVFTLVTQQLGKKPIPPVVRLLTGAIGKRIFRQFMKPRIQDQIDFIEAHLAQQDYFAGTFSFADIQMSFALMALVKTPEMTPMPHIQAFIARVQNRDAYKKAQAKSPDGGQVRG